MSASKVVYLLQKSDGSIIWNKWDGKGHKHKSTKVKDIIKQTKLWQFMI